MLYFCKLQRDIRLLPRSILQHSTCCTVRNEYQTMTNSNHAKACGFQLVCLCNLENFEHHVQIVYTCSILVAHELAFAEIHDRIQLKDAEPKAKCKTASPPGPTGDRNSVAPPQWRVSWPNQTLSVAIPLVLRGNKRRPHCKLTVNWQVHTSVLRSLNIWTWYIMINVLYTYWCVFTKCRVV